MFQTASQQGFLWNLPPEILAQTSENLKHYTFRQESVVDSLRPDGC